MVTLTESPLASLALLLALAAAATACASDGGTRPSPGAEYGAPVVLGVGDAMVVGDDGLTLRFEGVSNDSRCPVDVNCIWEGEALVLLRAQAPSQEARTLEVRVRGTGGSGTGEYAGRFTVQVTKLEPAPVSTAPIPASAYKATVVVTRR
jgi:hypothetical protein